MSETRATQRIELLGGQFHGAMVEIAPNGHQIAIQWATRREVYVATREPGVYRHAPRLSSWLEAPRRPGDGGGGATFTPPTPPLRTGETESPGNVPGPG